MNPRQNWYTEEHEWVSREEGGRSRIGLTDYAQSQLGDLVYMDLPLPGTEVKQFEKIGEIESVKAVSDFFAPVSGKVLEVNGEAIDAPDIVNEDPYGRGWLILLELSDASELDTLMSAEDYDALLIKLGSE